MLLVMIGLTVSVTAFAEDNKTIVEQMTGAVDDVNLPTAGGEAAQVDASTNKIVGKIIQAFLGIFGVLFLALMVYGGFKWMIAQGREEEVQKAKTIIQAAIIGFGIVVSAYAIAVFVTNAFFSAAGG